MKTIATAVFLIFVFLPVIVFAKPEIREVTAKGVGASEREAVEDAFRNAIEESIGLYVSSETQIQNDKLIKDSILTSSNGYIENYRLSSVSHEDGVTKVEITALVKIQDVKSKLASLNVSMLPADELANIHARLSTKIKRNQDAEEVLKKELNDFFRKENIAEMLSVKLLSYRIFENKIKMDKTVPYEISFETSINLKNYNKIIKNIAKLFENLGGKLNKILNISFSRKENSAGAAGITGDNFYEYNDKLGCNRRAREIKDISNMYFGLVFINNDKFELRHYAFPSEYRLIYPWKTPDHGYDSDHFEINDMRWIVKFIGDNDKIVFQKELSYRDIGALDATPIRVLNFFWEDDGRFKPGWRYKKEGNGPGYYIRQGGNNIGPFIHRPLYPFSEGSCCWKGSSMVRSVPMKYNDVINVDILYSIKKVEVSYIINKE